MDNEPEEPKDEARLNATMKDHQIAWEAEAVRTFGLPAVRIRKNRRYVQRLIRKHSEPTIRGILKALSTLDDPMCCENLRNHDLDTGPLEKIIQPFELLGLHFRILKVSGAQVTVDIGEAYGTVGSGGRFLLERLDDDSFRIIDMRCQWIA